MNELARKTLGDLIKTYGRGLCDDSRRTEALLRDLCGAQRREISVLVGAMRERVPQDLLGSTAGAPGAILIGRLVKRLEDDLGLAPAAAQWAVETWALALGVATEAELARARPAEPAPGAAAAGAAAPKAAGAALGKVASAAAAAKGAAAQAAAAKSTTGAQPSARAAAPALPPATFREVVTVAGTGHKGFADGPGRVAQLKNPCGIAFAAPGVLYVADEGNRRLRSVQPDGSAVATLGGTGRFLDLDLDGSLDQAGFADPVAVDVDGKGVLYVAEQKGTVRIVRLDTRQVTSIQGVSLGDSWTGPNTRQRGLAVTADGIVFVSVASSQGGGGYYVLRIQLGAPAVRFGTGGGAHRDGPANDAEFNQPAGLAFHDATETLYIADAGNHSIRKLGDNGVRTVVGDNSGWRSGAGCVDGPLATARFREPRGVAVDGAGRIYVADTGNHRIRRIDPDGTVSTVAGGQRGFADGPPASARFDKPVDLAIGLDGTLFVVDQGNHSVRALRP